MEDGASTDGPSFAEVGLSEGEGEEGFGLSEFV